MRKLSTALIVMVAALGMGAVQWANSQGLSSIDSSQMRLAVKTGSVNRVRTLIQQGVNPNVKDADGYTPLHQAAVDGFPEAVDALLATTVSPDVDAKTNDGYTALHLAAVGGTDGHLKVVESLLEADAEVDEKAPGGRTALHIAAWGGYSEVVEALLEEDAAIDDKATGGWTPLHLAAHGTTQGHLDSVRLLRDKRADRNIEAQDRKPWQYAFERNQRAIVDILNPLIPSALTNAVADDDVDEVRDLIALGYSDVNEKNSAGQPTLYLAVARKRRDVLQVLLAANGIDVNAKESGGYAPLHLAVHHQDSDADTPAGKNLLDIVKDLIAADGIDVNLLGGTSLGALRPLTIARNRNNDKAEQALIAAGATGVPEGGLVFSPSGTLIVPEGGSTDLNIKLGVKPDRDVTVSAGSYTRVPNTDPPVINYEGRLAITDGDLTFTPSNWNTFQAVPVESTTIDDDAVDIEGLIITVIAEGNSGFTPKPSEVFIKRAKVDDDEEVGFVVSRKGSVSSLNARLQIKEGQYIEETIKLSSQPTKTVNLEISYVYTPGEGFPFLNSLWYPTFTPQNWNVPQTVRIDATHDSNNKDDFGQMVYGVRREGHEYDGASFEFAIISREDDVAKPVFNPFQGLTIPEGTSKTFTLRLGKKPRERQNQSEDSTCQNSSRLPPCAVVVLRPTIRYFDVTYPTGNDPQWATEIGQGRVIFTQSNWDRPQTITVAAPEDSNLISEAGDVYVSVWSAEYSTPTQGQSTRYPIRTTDDDIQGQIRFSPTVFKVPEGGSNTLSISLSAKPKQTIRITTESDLPRIGFSADEFTIAPRDWNESYQLRVISTDEESENIRDDEDETGRIVLRVADGLTSPTMTIGVTEEDPEVKGAIVQTNKITVGGRVKVSEGGPGRISISLDEKPNYNTTLTIAKNNNNLTLTPSSMTFTPDNWDTPQVLDLEAKYTSGNNDTITNLTLSTTGGFIATPVSIPVDIISAGQHRYLFFLFNVAGHQFQTSERFNYNQRPADWKTDFGNIKWKEGEEYTMTLKLSGPIPATWEKESLNTSSGFNVWNKHNFRMHTNIRAGNDKATLSPRVRHFTEYNWNETVTFTITTLEDDDADEDTFEVEFDENAHRDAGSYIKGAGRMIVRFPPIEDDDIDGNVVLSTNFISATDRNKTKSFTVKLDTKPKADIIVTLIEKFGRAIPSDLDFSKTSLTFTPTNYNQAQTISFTTSPDDDDDCDRTTFKVKAGDGYSAESIIQIYVKDRQNRYC
ncbi:ankyrin repeat domain-containing protein [Thioalkalivibrio sp. HK1]|uniref:ankyrin repeat domain-containing protein n=1 Tax=Thioalkalivibrio sp. HK1 TaxID=1469245 RepID=UPI00046F6E6E|nr:ankyrin repeat domain-containing protein [Thioalkalivibrio sp. HK1]